MPWKYTEPMDEKERFVVLAQGERFTVSELCKDFGISRKTGHKYLRRYKAEGRAGLQERSRAAEELSERDCRDRFSRYVIGCHGCANQQFRGTLRVCKKLMRMLPERLDYLWFSRIRTRRRDTRS